MNSKKPKINEIPKLDDYIPDKYEEFRTQFNLIHQYYGINLNSPNANEKNILFLSLRFATGTSRNGLHLKAQGKLDKLWKLLDEQYLQPKELRLYQLELDLQQLRWKEDDTVDKYITNFYNITERITLLDPQYQLTDLKTFTILFNGLPKETQQQLPHVNAHDTSSKKLIEILRHRERVNNKEETPAGESLYNNSNPSNRGRGGFRGGYNGDNRG